MDLFYKAPRHLIREGLEPLRTSPQFAGSVLESYQADGPGLVRVVWGKDSADGEPGLVYVPLLEIEDYEDLIGKQHFKAVTKAVLKYDPHKEAVVLATAPPFGTVLRVLKLEHQPDTLGRLGRITKAIRTLLSRLRGR